MPHQAGDTLQTAGVDRLRLGPAAPSSAAASADRPERRSQGVHPSGGGQLDPGYYVTVDGKVGKVRNFMTGRARTSRPETLVSRVIARKVRRLGSSVQCSRRLAGQTFPQAVRVEQQNYISGSYGTYLFGTGRPFGLRELRKRQNPGARTGSGNCETPCRPPIS